MRYVHSDGRKTVVLVYGNEMLGRGLINEISRTRLVEGTIYSKLDYLIEYPLFTDSKWRNLSQIVDCVAFVSGRNSGEIQY